ncbi:MAG: D-alanyl-D-alanine carboxypeptidase/D-alanyl-D-alanine endopeptidase [Gammaproteobacteria bacterium]
MRVSYWLLALWTMLFLSDAALAQQKKTARTHRASKTKVVKAAVRKAAPVAAIPTLYGAGQLNDQLNRLINNDEQNADVGVYVKSMKSGEALYARNIHQAMTPASTMKILTAEAALIYLGPDYRFSTQLLTDGKATVKNGILQGNLYIVLSGDPTITYNDLVDLLLTLRSQQIQAIAGNVYIDYSAYDQRYYGPGWIEKDKGYCYAAPISASIINHNCLSFQVTPAKMTGRSAQVVISPKYFLPTIHNSVTTKAGGSSCGVHLTKEANSEITIEGCLSKGRYPTGISYVVTDIPDYNKALFKSVLKQLQVNVYGSITSGTTPKTASMIGQHASKPLHELVNDMLKKSDNIIAGSLFKKIGQLYSRQPGSWENGRAAVSAILAKHAGVNTSGLKILDGSGLSPDNLATPAQMMQVLNFAYHHYGTSYEFISALPIAGVDGTLKHRMYNISRKVRAKTGTISGVVGLAGYAMGKDNEPLAFVIMINSGKGMGWKYKALEDKIATALTKYARPS